MKVKISFREKVDYLNLLPFVDKFWWDEEWLLFFSILLQQVTKEIIHKMEIFLFVNWEFREIRGNFITKYEYVVEFAIGSEERGKRICFYYQGFSVLCIFWIRLARGPLHLWIISSPFIEAKARWETCGGKQCVVARGAK